MIILLQHNHLDNYEFEEGRRSRQYDAAPMPINPPIEVEPNEEAPMSQDGAPSSDRRRFLKSVAAASLPSLIASQGEAAPVAESVGPTAPQSAHPAPAASGASAAGYQILSLDEAAFAEALVDHMWPKDQHSPSGSEIGIATFIDRQLAGAFGQGDRLYSQGPFRKGKPQHGYQLPLTPAEYFKAGVEAAGAACARRFLRGFDKLTDQERE
jgi:gluconate 2-dehydrogenase gamma chain